MAGVFGLTSFEFETSDMEQATIWSATDHARSDHEVRKTAQVFFLPSFVASMESKLRKIADGAMDRLTDHAQSIDIAISGGGACAEENEESVLEAAIHMLSNTILHGMRCRMHGQCWVSLEVDRKWNRLVVIDDGWDLTGETNTRDMTSINQIAIRHDGQALLWRAYGLTVCELDLPVVSMRGKDDNIEDMIA